MEALLNLTFVKRREEHARSKEYGCICGKRVVSPLPRIPQGNRLMVAAVYRVLIEKEEERRHTRQSRKSKVLLSLDKFQDPMKLTSMRLKPV